MDTLEQERRDAEFSALYGHFHEPIVGFIAGRLSNPADAEDVAGDVFLAALRAYRIQRREIRFRPWIYEIARNACIDHHRRLRRRPQTSPLADHVAGLAGPDAHSHFEHAGRLAQLCRALGELSALDRELIAMREMAGMSYPQLAEHTGLTVPAVETALFRARRRAGARFQLLSGERSAPPRPTRRIPAVQRAA